MTNKARLAFDSEPTQAFGEKYLELLYTNWFEIMRSARKAVFLAVLLILGFFLLDPAKAATLKLGPLETSNIAAVLVLLPAIISFLLFEAIDLTLSAVYYREASEAVMKKLFPAIYDNDFELFLEPASTFAWGAGSNLSIALQPIRGRPAKLLENATHGALVITWAGALIFLGYAYMTLLEHGEVNCFVLIGSILFTLFNIARAALQIAIVWGDDA